jgi:hypothetical protein
MRSWIFGGQKQTDKDGSVRSANSEETGTVDATGTSPQYPGGGGGGGGSQG